MQFECPIISIKIPKILYFYLTRK